MNKFTFFFFAFLTNSSSNFSFRAMRWYFTIEPIFSNFFTPFILVFQHNCLFFFSVIFFGMGTGWRISCKSKSPSTYENWPFNLPLSSPPSNSPLFCALGKAENALLATTLWGSTKLAMSTPKLKKKMGELVCSQQCPQSITYLPFSQNLSNKV